MGPSRIFLCSLTSLVPNGLGSVTSSAGNRLVIGIIILLFAVHLPNANFEYIDLNKTLFYSFFRMTLCRSTNLSSW